MLKIIRRVFDFGDWARSNPSLPPPGDMLDAQIDEIIDQVDRQDHKLEAFIATYAGDVDIIQSEVATTVAFAVADDRKALKEARIEVNHLRNELTTAIALVQRTHAQMQTLMAAPPPQPPPQPIAAPAPVPLVDPNNDNDAFAADQNAMLWAEVSHEWAEHMPDTIPPNILAEMAISGEHWSARWWANQAANAFGTLTSLYLGVHATPPTSNADGSAIAIGAIYYNSLTQQPYVWTGAGWAPFTTPSKTSDVSLFYRATAGQTVFPLTTLDIDGESTALNPDAPQDLEVHRNGSLLIPEEGSGFGHYSVNIATSTITLKTGAALNDTIAVNVLVAADNLRPGGVLINAIRDIDIDPVTGLPGRQDGTRRAFTMVVAAGTKSVAIDKTEELSVSVDGVIQEPGNAYVASGNTITFDTAPALDSVVFITWFAAGGGVGGGGVEEAPDDGTPYWRMSHAWAPATGGSGGTMPEAPTDGKIYGRKSAGWQNVFVDGVLIPTAKPLAFNQTSGAITVNEGGGGSYAILTLGQPGSSLLADVFNVTAKAATKTKLALCDQSAVRRGHLEVDAVTNRLSVAVWDASGTSQLGEISIRDTGAFFNGTRLIEDAPSDGEQYARLNGGWDIVEGAVPEAPQDGKLYARKDGSWVEIATPSGIWTIEPGTGNAILTVSGAKVASVTPAGFLRAKDDVEAFSTGV